MLQNQSSISVTDERLEGAAEEYSKLSLKMTDDEIAASIGKRVEQSEAFWNAKLNLDKIRDQNESYWLGTYRTDDKLYEYQKDYFYKNPRIFIDIETLIPMTLANPPQPIVGPDGDDEASIELAKNLGSALLAKYDDCFLERQFMMVARHLLMGMRLGVMKYRWNDDIGPMGTDGESMGDIEIYTPRPTKVVVEQRSNDPENVSMIAEYLDATVEELGYKFDKKKDEIWKSLGISRGVGSQLHTYQGYMEIHFTTYNDNGQPKEAIAWKLKNIVLGSMKQPNFDYTEPTLDQNGNAVPNNYVNKPLKPYVFFNYLNSGKYIIDDISLVEQAARLQHIHDKRGAQLVENADQAASGVVYDTDMIKPEEMAKMIGDPNERIGVKGNVNNAISRIPPPILDRSVLEDKLDARGQIDDIFGVHSPIKGSQADSPTLGQEVLSQRSDISRNRPLSTSIEDGATRLYKGLAQMMKVFYDDPSRKLRYPTEDGNNYGFLDGYNGKQIRPGMTINVKSGSVLPKDPVTKAQQTMKTMAILDPLTIAEGLGMPNPKESAKRIMYFRMFPDRYMAEIIGDVPGQSQQDPSAIQEQQLMIQGQNVPPQQNPTKAHLSTHQAFLESPDFQGQPPQVQEVIKAHVSAEVENGKQALGMSAPPEAAPPPEVMPQGNQQPGFLQKLLGL